MNTQAELTIVMPVFNEEGSIKKVIEKWSRGLDSLEIDYVFRAYNDGSRDRTGKILEELASANPRLEIHHTPNRGHGPTILDGYRNTSNSPWLLQIDSDDEMGPDGFPKLWEKRHDYDFLLGRREGRTSPWSRSAISLISRLVVSVCYGQGIYDVNSPYRLMRVEKFKSLFDRLPEDTFAPNIIISGHACRFGLRVFETPVYYRQRPKGKVSIKRWRLLNAAMKSFFQTVRFRFWSHESADLSK